MRGGLAWLLAGTAIGAAIAVLVLNSDGEPSYETGYDTGYDGVDRAAAKTYGWGVKTRSEGKVGGVVGKVKEGFGKLTGDEDLQAEGTIDRAVGKVKDVAGEVGTAAAQTLHDLNK